MGKARSVVGALLALVSVFWVISMWMGLVLCEYSTVYAVPAEIPASVFGTAFLLVGAYLLKN